MKQIFKTKLFKYGYGQYFQPSKTTFSLDSKYLRFFDNALNLQNKRIITSSDTIADKYQSTISGNNYYHKNKFFTSEKTSWTPRNNYHNPYAYPKLLTNGRYSLINNYAYMRVLDKQQRHENSGTVYKFTHIDGLEYNVYTTLVNESTSTSVYVSQEAIVMYRGDYSDSDLYQTKIMGDVRHPITGNLGAGTSQVLWVDTDNQYIYLYNNFRYPVNDNRYFYYQYTDIIRVGYSIGAEIALGDYEILNLPYVANYGYVYGENGRVFFAGLSKDSNPIFISTFERTSGSNYIWYNSSIIHESRYIITEVDTSTGVPTVLHDLSASDTWGAGGDYSSNVNRTVGMMSPTHFEDVGNNIFVSYFPEFNSSNELNLLMISWDKNDDKFTIEPASIDAQANIKDYFEDTYSQAAYPYTGVSNQYWSLDNCTFAPIMLQIVEDELNNKYLSIWNEHVTDRAKSYITLQPSLNIATFAIDQAAPKNLQLVQTVNFDAMRTLFTTENNNKCFCIHENSLAFWEFDSANYWQKKLEESGIYYSLIRKSDDSVYAISSDQIDFNGLNSDDSISPIHTYDMSLLEWHSDQLINTTTLIYHLDIKLPESITYTGSSQQVEVLVAVFDSQDNFIQTDLTLTTSSPSALWNDNSSQILTVSTEATKYLSLILDLTSPGFFYISGKM